MAEQPRKVGVYDKDTTSDTQRTTDGGVDIQPSRTSGVNWWIVGLVVLLILIALFVLF